MNAVAPDGAGWGVCAYFLLFPGFFAYHSLLGLGQIRAVLGGYFAPVALALAIPLLLVYLHRLYQQRDRFTGADAAFWAFLAYFALVVLIHAVAGATAGVLANHSFALVYLAASFIAFKCLDPAADSLRRANWLAVVAMSATIFAFAVDGVFYLGALGAARDPEAVATYQGFSRSYLVSLSLALACARSAPERWLLYALGLPSLYVNAARSEFVALLFLIPALELALSRRRWLLGSALLGLAAAAWTWSSAWLAWLPQNRMLELLDLSHSRSATLRHQLSDQAWQTVAAHPWLGDYASYVPGYYAHSLLSAWVDLGLFGISLLFLLLAIPALHAGLASATRPRPAPAMVLAWAFLSSTLLLLFSSHYFADMLIGASLGAYARALHEAPHG